MSVDGKHTSFGEHGEFRLLRVITLAGFTGDADFAGTNVPPADLVTLQRNPAGGAGGAQFYMVLKSAAGALVGRGSATYTAAIIRVRHESEQGPIHVVDQVAVTGIPVQRAAEDPDAGVGLTGVRITSLANLPAAGEATAEIWIREIG